MSKAPRLSQAVSEAPQILPAPGPGDVASPRTQRRLLSPELVEAGVAAIDVLLIVAAGLLFSSAYYSITGSASNAMPYGGMGLIVAANFVAIMVARRNY